MATSQPLSAASSEAIADDNSHSDSSQDGTHPGLKTIITSLHSLKTESAFQELTNLYGELEEVRAELKARKEDLLQSEKRREKQQADHDHTCADLSESFQRINQKQSLVQKDLSTKIADLQAAIQQDISARKELEDRAKNGEAEVVKLQKALQNSNKLCKEAREKVLEHERHSEQSKGEIARLKQDSQHKDSEISGLKRSKSNTVEERDKVMQLLKLTQGELANLRGLAVQLTTEDLRITKDRMQSLWESASAMMKRHLPRRLPANNHSDGDILSRLRTVHGIKHSVPLPRSDSVVARDMRYAVVMASLFHALDVEIFQPNYLVDEEIDIRNHLLRQAIDDSRKESFSRAFMLSLCQDRQRDLLRTRAAEVVNSLVWLVELLLTENQITSFKQDLQAFVESACEAWHVIQRLDTRYEPNLYYAKDEGIEWQTISLESETSAGNAAAPAKRGKSDQEELVVFPRLYVVKNAVPRAITQGVVLWRSQTLEADNELRNMSPPSPMFGRSGLSRPRSRRESQPSILPPARARVSSSTT